MGTQGNQNKSSQSMIWDCHVFIVWYLKWIFLIIRYLDSPMLNQYTTTNHTAMTRHRIPCNRVSTISLSLAFSYRDCTHSTGFVHLLSVSCVDSLLYINYLIATRLNRWEILVLVFPNYFKKQHYEVWSCQGKQNVYNHRDLTFLLYLVVNSWMHECHDTVPRGFFQA